jgi:hypothetical protein
MDLSAVWARCAVVYHGQHVACAGRAEAAASSGARLAAADGVADGARGGTAHYRPARPPASSKRIRCCAVSFFGCTGLSVVRAQALAQLTEVFPSVPPSAIADALGKAGGDVQHAADRLFKATQAPLRVLWVLGEPPSDSPPSWSGGSVL